MTLLEAVQSLDSLDGNGTIYAAEPWTARSEAIVTEEPEAGGVPVAVQERGMKYFLEVFIAREVLEDWVPDTASTLADKCARLIQYATTDA
jgi:hypothetical protein